MILKMMSTKKEMLNIKHTQLNNKAERSKHIESKHTGIRTSVIAFSRRATEERTLEDVGITGDCEALPVIEVEPF